jgi:hypothetical protein
MSIGIPSLPKNTSNEELFNYILSLDNWIKNIYQEGLQAPMFETVDLNKMPTIDNPFQQVGKLFYDNDTNEFKRVRKTGSNTVVEVW